MAKPAKPRAKRRHRCAIEFVGFPGELQAVAAAEFERLSALIPDWCRRLRVNYEAEPRDPGTVAQTGASLEYRQGTITLFPCYFSPDRDALRASDLRHELVHLLMWPHSSAGDELVATLEGNPTAQALARERLRCGLESATEDIVLALERSLR